MDGWIQRERLVSKSQVVIVCDAMLKMEWIKEICEEVLFDWTSVACNCLLRLADIALHSTTKWKMKSHITKALLMREWKYRFPENLIYKKWRRCVWLHMLLHFFWKNFWFSVIPKETFFFVVFMQFSYQTLVVSNKTRPKNKEKKTHLIECYHFRYCNTTY